MFLHLHLKEQRGALHPAFGFVSRFVFGVPYVRSPCVPQRRQSSLHWERQRSLTGPIIIEIIHIRKIGTFTCPSFQITIPQMYSNKQLNIVHIIKLSNIG